MEEKLPSIYLTPGGYSDPFQNGVVRVYDRYGHSILEDLPCKSIKVGRSVESGYATVDMEVATRKQEIKLHVLSGHNQGNLKIGTVDIHDRLTPYSYEIVCAGYECLVRLHFEAEILSAPLTPQQGVELCIPPAS